MQIRSLDIFCDVAQMRSFSKVAKARGVTQPAVSQAVHHLEERLGVCLFDRSTRPLSLTQAGSRYFDGVKTILADLQELEDAVITQANQFRGPLAIGAIYSVGLSYMPDAEEEFRRLYPDVDVRVEYGRNEAVIDRLMAGQVELGLVSFPKSNKQLVAVPWQKEPMRLVCSPDHKFARRTEVSLGDLDGIEMVGFEQALLVHEMIQAELQRLGVRVDFRVAFDNADSIVRAIQANRSAGFLPEAVVRRETAIGSLRVVACRELSMARPLGIVFRRSGGPSQAGAEFGSLLLGRPLIADSTKHGVAGRKPPPNAQAADSPTSVVA